MYQTAPLRYAAQMQWLVRTVMAILLVGTFALWASPDAISLGVARRVLPSGAAWIDQRAQGMGLLISLLPLTVALLSLWHTDCLFSLYGRGEGLSLAAAGRLRRIGRGVMLLGVLGPPVGSALSFILTMAAPPGARTVTIGFSSQDLALVVVGCLLLAIAAMAAQAARLADDHASIV